jgi:hypothetical protein
LATSQLSYSASDQDPVLVFDVIVAVVVGGTSLSGGVGSMWQTAVGLAILAVLQNGLNLLDINTFYHHQGVPHHHRGQPRCLDTVALGRAAAASGDFDPARGSDSRAKHLRPIIGGGSV